MAIKRRIEIFTAGCPLCDEAVHLVNVGRNGDV